MIMLRSLEYLEGSLYTALAKLYPRTVNHINNEYNVGWFKLK